MPSGAEAVISIRDGFCATKLSSVPRSARYLIHLVEDPLSGIHNMDLSSQLIPVKSRMLLNQACGILLVPAGVADVVCQHHVSSSRLLPVCP